METGTLLPGAWAPRAGLVLRDDDALNDGHKNFPDRVAPSSLSGHVWRYSRVFVGRSGCTGKTPGAVTP